jgi:hypothetical protein
MSWYVKNMKNINFETAVTRVIKNTELFYGLKNIGGHKLYHLEGDQLTHTKMVWEYSKDCNYPGWLQNVCILHDIGKIFTSVCNGPDDWSYPHHSTSGAKNLHLFINEDAWMFEVYKWFIENHIKPLFWKSLDDSKNLTPPPAGGEQYCTKYNLLRLVKADLEGSISVDGNTDTKNKIEDFLDEAYDENIKFICPIDNEFDWGTGDQYQRFTIHLEGPAGDMDSLAEYIEEYEGCICLLKCYGGNIEKYLQDLEYGSYENTKVTIE